MPATNKVSSRKNILITGGAGFTRPRLTPHRIGGQAHRQRADKWYYTYVLESLKDDKLYIGWTNNLDKRIEEHNSKKVNSTKWRSPLNLIYFEACLSKDMAIKREKYFKTGFGRRFLKNRLAGSRLPAHISQGKAGGGRVGLYHSKLVLI